MKIAVSACLIGKNTKYNGKNNYCTEVLDFLKDKEYLCICPEVTGGLKIPRSPSEIINGEVFNKDGENVTNHFIEGALKELERVIQFNPDLIILKEKSPSCGYHFIYDGTFQNHLIDGQGVFTKLALKHGFKVISENDLIQKKLSF